MSRSGYSDDVYDQWAHIRWRGAVAQAMSGKRGQAFLREMLAAMDALPEKRLVALELEAEGQVCAIGSVGRARGIDMSDLDPQDYTKVAATFGIAEALAQEIVFMNDEGFFGLGYGHPMTPEARFAGMRDWIISKIKQSEPA